MKDTKKKEYQISIRGKLVRKKFATVKEAHDWAEFNYSKDSVYKIVETKKGKKIICRCNLLEDKTISIFLCCPKHGNVWNGIK